MSLLDIFKNTEEKLNTSHLSIGIPNKTYQLDIIGSLEEMFPFEGGLFMKAFSWKWSFSETWVSCYIMKNGVLKRSIFCDENISFNAIAVSHNGFIAYIPISHMDKWTIYFHDLVNDKPLGNLHVEEIKDIRYISLKFSADGKYLIVYGDDDTCDEQNYTHFRVFDWRITKIIYEWYWDPFLFTPDNRYLYFWKKEKNSNMTRVSIESDEKEKTFLVHVDTSLSVSSVNYDSTRFIANMHGFYHKKLFDIETWECKEIISTSLDNIHDTVWLSRDSDRLAILQKNTLTILSVAEKDKKKVVACLSESMLSQQFFSSMVISTDYARIWIHLKKWEQVKIIEINTDDISSAENNTL